MKTDFFPRNTFPAHPTPWKIFLQLSENFPSLLTALSVFPFYRKIDKSERTRRSSTHRSKENLTKESCRDRAVLAVLVVCFCWNVHAFPSQFSTHFPAHQHRVRRQPAVSESRTNTRTFVTLSPPWSPIFVVNQIALSSLRIVVWRVKCESRNSFIYHGPKNTPSSSSTHQHQRMCTLSLAIQSGGLRVAERAFSSFRFTCTTRACIYTTNEM